MAALDKAATNLREKVGESLSTIQKYDAPIAEATTPSLEALKFHSPGAKTQQEKIRETVEIRESLYESVNS